MKKALIIKYPGTNCDEETKIALQAVGFEVKVSPISLLKGKDLVNFQIVVFPGGFSYGDYIMSGKLGALEFQRKIGDDLRNFHRKGGYILGICNGFQILIHLGLLPFGSLTENVSRTFLCRWVKLKKTGLKNTSPYLHLLPEDFELPIAHAQGRFLLDIQKAEEYVSSGVAPLVYGEDINGSSAQIAAIQSQDGRIFGLMPHPERFLQREQHYDKDWEKEEWGWGYYFFSSIFQSLEERG